MKYLLIFLPIFAFAKNDSIPDHLPWDTIPGGDSTLYGLRTPILDTCWEIKDGWMSLKPGCISVPSVSSSGEIISFKTQEFYISDRKPRFVESFKYLGAHYDFRENGWYKEIDTIPVLYGDGASDYLNGDIKLEGGTMYRFQPPGWTPCHQHIGKSESYQREKADTSEVKLLIWTGCSLEEIGATKYLFYNEMQVAKNTGGLAVYITETIKVDVVARYVSENKWIKPSYVIKEL